MCEHNKLDAILHVLEEIKAQNEVIIFALRAMRRVDAFSTQITTSHFKPSLESLEEIGKKFWEHLQDGQKRRGV